MADSQIGENMQNDRRTKVMVGDLPPDFLCVNGVPGSQNQQIYMDQQAAAALQAAQGGGLMFMSPNIQRLTITVTQAKLTKNYGLMKMDLYCRMRIGHSVFETQTSNGGGKNPRWNKTIQCHVPPGVDSIYIEIFDEKAFTMDDRVAWVHVPIPDKVFSESETVDEWYHLNGKQGDGKEGIINLVFSQTTAPVAVQQPVVYSTARAPVVVVPGGMPAYYPPQPGYPQPQPYPPQVGGVPVTVQQPPPPQPQGPLYTDEDVQQVKDMFPNVDQEVIKSVLEANRGNKDATINNLLSMDS